MNHQNPAAVNATTTAAAPAAGEHRRPPPPRHRQDGRRQEQPQHQPVRQVERGAQQHPAGHRGRVRPHPAARGADGEQRHAPGQHGGEHAVRRHPDPHRTGQQHPERQRRAAPRPRRRARAASPRPRRTPTPRPAPSPRRRPRRRRGRSGPAPRRPGSTPGGWAPTCVVQCTGWSVRMWSANVASIVPHAGDPRHVVQVLLAAGQPLDDPALPAVDQRQRQRPHRRGHPRRGEQPPPAAASPPATGPHPTTATAVTTATGVPGPTCGSHCASSGGKGSSRFTPAGQQHPAHDRGRHDEHHRPLATAAPSPPGPTAGTRLDPDPATARIPVTGGPRATGRARPRRPAGPRAGHARRRRRRCRRARRRPARPGSGRRRAR